MSSPQNEAVQRRANDVLEHALLSSWMQVSDMGLCVLDDDSNVVVLNQAACDLLGVENTTALNAPLKALLKHLDRNDGLIPWIAAPGFEGQRHVTRTLGSSKQHLLLKFRSIREIAGKRFKMLSITDLTIVLAAQQMEEQRRQWQALNAGVVVSDALSPDMPVVYVNAKFEEMSGYSSAEMLGRNCRHLQGAESGQTGLVAIRQAIREKTNGYAVLRNFRKDGSLFINELFISPIKAANGEVTHFLGIQHLRDADFAGRSA
jgi:PAS domain S-box-containing protein